jgi:hypothetical protein
MAKQKQFCLYQPSQDEVHCCLSFEVAVSVANALRLFYKVNPIGWDSFDNNPYEVREWFEITGRKITNFQFKKEVKRTWQIMDFMPCVKFDFERAKQGEQVIIIGKEKHYLMFVCTLESFNDKELVFVDKDDTRLFVSVKHLSSNIISMVRIPEINNPQLSIIDNNFSIV